LALDIHHGEEPARNIYGTATPEERESLAEEEVPFFVVPEIPPEFKN
jgi:hypothetical protein